MQILVKGCIFLFLSVHAAMSFAQQVFYFESATAKAVTAATYDHSKNAVMFFSGNNVFYYPVGSDKTIVPEWYSMEAFNKVDAALEWDEDNSLIFNGSSYRMFKHSTGEFVTEYTQWPALPAEWDSKLDGAVKWNKDLIFFFYNKEYAMYNIASNSFTGLDNITNWNGWPTQWGEGIDDAFNTDDGFIYFIRGGEIMPYSIEQKTFFNPKQITALNTVQPSSAPPGLTKGLSKPASLQPSASSNTQYNTANTASANIVTEQENNAAYFGGCITGSPAGAGLREVQSPVEGDQQGRLFTDNLPKGYKVVEIKIYTSKIWGKTVISGMQTILVSTTAQRVEQPTLGRKTISEYTFALDDDECITGINGTKNGESGNFIYSVQLLTSKRTSPVYGERINEKGSETFSITMPGQSVFNGFVGNFNTNMTGIGIKYYGQQSTGSSSSATLQENHSNENTSEAVNGQVSIQTNAGDNSGNAPDTPQSIVDAYLDTYEDYTKNLGNDAKWGVQPLPGIDWLGCGFDILKFDPLNPNETKNRKIFRGIVVSNSGERAGNESQYLKPYGAEFGSVNSGNDIDSSSWVESYKSFTNSFNVGGTGSVSIPEAASASLSSSYSEMNRVSLGSESIYHFSKVVRKIHEIDLSQTWKDAATGQKYKQKLHPTFKDDVAGLPVIKAGVPSISTDQMKKNQPLPGTLEQVKNKYLDFIINMAPIMPAMWPGVVSIFKGCR